jgi:tripartite-type tricarboxylate transporter receptor subunit TctC
VPSRSTWRALLPAAGLLLHAAAAAAQGTPPDLSILDGRTLRFVITGNAGGGTDRYARTFIEGLQQVLPRTQILAQNAEGGGGTLALIEAQDQRGDLINLVVTHTTPVFTQMLGSELSVAFDLNEFHWIGALANNQRVLVVRGTIGDPSLAALAARENPLVGPTETAGSASDIELRLVDATTDLEIELVPGVEDALRDSLLLAGTADLAAGNYLALKPLIDAGTAVPLLRLGVDGYPPDLAASVPALGDLVRPDASPVVVGMLDTLNKLGRMILAAPQNDPAVVGALRLAFDRTVATPGLAGTFAARNLLLAPTSGEELAAGIAVLPGDEDAKALLARYLECAEEGGAAELACLAP